MAAEFYRKTAALYEEFKKREMHSLSVERSLNSSYSLNSDIALPLQDYLEKINRRERETEKSYRDLMKHLEEMDKCTDQMSLKLEKLNALRNVSVSSNITTWPSVDETFDRPLQPYYGDSFRHGAPSTSFPPTSLGGTLLPISEFDYSSTKLSSNSESTQTEHLFCDQCHYPLTVNSNLNISRMPRSSMNPNDSVSVQHVMNQAPQLPFQSEIPFEHPVRKDSLPAESKNTNPKQNSDDLDSLAIVGNSDMLNAKIPFEADDISTERESSLNVIKENRNFIENQVINPARKRLSTDTENDLYSKEDGTFVNRENIETVPSKSDDESINHEFDFLESDKRPSVKGINNQPEVRVPVDQTDIKNDELNFAKSKGGDVLEKTSVLSNSFLHKTNNDRIFQSNEVTDTADINNLRHNESLKITHDMKADSSLSEGLPSPSHPEKVLTQSESDSFSENEMPLTATAAYQALLGNVSATRTIQKQSSLSDSDSEDEIENVLATAVRKSSNINFDVPLQLQKTAERKESVSEVKPKTEAKTSKPVSSNKPQNKLSKNTRKVLGLDTSSGSEVELEVKPAENKIDEDSDEFDFYG